MKTLLQILGFLAPALCALAQTTITSPSDIVLSPNNAGSMTGSSVILAPAPTSGSYNAPLRWGNGSLYSLGGGTTVFNSLPDHSGSFGYNLQKSAGDVMFGLGLEHDFKDNTGFRSTEFYYFWSGIMPAETGARRPFQFNVSNGLGVGQAAGYTFAALHVNQFYISDQALYDDHGLYLNFDPATPTLRWDGAATITGTLTAGNTLTVNGQFSSNYGGASNGVPGMFLMPNLGSAPNYATFYLGKSLAGSGNAAQWTWENYGTDSVNNAFSFGFAGVGGILRVTKNGTVSIAGNITATTFLEGTEQAASPAAPAANGYRIYAKDNGAGKTLLYVRFASGAEQQLAIEP